MALARALVPSEVSRQKGLSSSAKLSLFLRVSLSASSLHSTATIGTNESWTNSWTDCTHCAMAGLPGEWTSGARSEFGGGVDSHILGKNRAELGSAALLAGSLFRFVGLLGHVTSASACPTMCRNKKHQKRPKTTEPPGRI